MRWADILSAKVLPYLWLYVVVGIPYLLLGFTVGWVAMFDSGAASAFIAGVMVAAMGENLIEQAQEGFAGWAAVDGDDPPYSSLAAGVLLLAWNIYIAIIQSRPVHPSVNWVQILAFAVTAAALPLIRFALTPFDPSIEPRDGRVNSDAGHSRS